jgi:ABC-type uncharacterized transport system permease subunit
MQRILPSVLKNFSFREREKSIYLIKKKTESMEEVKDVQKNKPLAGFILSLIAGILILSGGIMIFFVPGFIQSISGSISEGMMTEEEIEEMEEGMSIAMSMLDKILIPFAIMGLISGILIIFGAVLGYQGKNMLGGLLVMIPSVLHIPAIVGIIGVIGGALIIWRVEKR